MDVSNIVCTIYMSLLHVIRNKIMSPTVCCSSCSCAIVTQWWPPEWTEPWEKQLMQMKRIRENIHCFTEGWAWWETSSFQTICIIQTSQAACWIPPFKPCVRHRCAMYLHTKDQFTPKGFLNWTWFILMLSCLELLHFLLLWMVSHGFELPQNSLCPCLTLSSMVINLTWLL